MRTAFARHIPGRQSAKAALFATACAFFAFVAVSCVGPGQVTESRTPPAVNEPRTAQKADKPRAAPEDGERRKAPEAGGRRAGPKADDDPVGRAFKSRASDVQVEGEGTVARVLSDDLSGSRHQRFLVRLASGQTLLVSHNIDIAPRVDGLKEGDSVAFKGEYVWNEKGGVIHWTHHDPQGRHVAGWVKHNGRTFK